MSLPHAVIIAGGQGRRLGGVRKAELKLGERRLIDRVAAALGAVQRPILVATGPEHPTPPGPYKGIPDIDVALGGPLAGLAAAVDLLAKSGVEDGLLVSVAVDTPFLPADFAAVMMESLGDHAAVYARWGTEFYPPNTLWRLSILACLPDRVRDGTAPKSLKLLLGEIGAISHDWQASAPLNPFDNLNTFSDLIRLSRREANR